MKLPTFLSLKLVHGLLGHVAISAVVSWAIPALLCKGDALDIAFLQWACFLAFLTISPFFAWMYSSVSSNQY